MTQPEVMHRQMGGEGGGEDLIPAGAITFGLMYRTNVGETNDEGICIHVYGNDVAGPDKELLRFGLGHDEPPLPLSQRPRPEERTPDARLHLRGRSSGDIPGFAAHQHDGQAVLDLGIEIERNVGGIEMGVLENGIPYLTQRGLAAMSGAARSTIFEITKEWEDTFDDPIPPKGRTAFFKDYLFKNGYDEREIFI